jgi:hypothetical protein
MPLNDPDRNLAFRNLERAKMVTRATGQQMANFLRSKGVTLTKLTSGQIRDGRRGIELTQDSNQNTFRMVDLLLFPAKVRRVSWPRSDGSARGDCRSRLHREPSGEQRARAPRSDPVALAVVQRDCLPDRHDGLVSIPRQ